jgi:squalene-hopene/tetraprenyl-beta-curcumene cyclase
MRIHKSSLLVKAFLALYYFWNFCFSQYERFQINGSRTSNRPDVTGKMNPTGHSQKTVAEVLEELESDYSGEPLPEVRFPSGDRGAARSRAKRSDARNVLSGHHSRQTSTVESSWTRRLEKAIHSATQFFLKTQNDEEYWWAELESNVSITSEYIMLYYLLGRSDPGKERSMASYILSQQRFNGSWGLYYGDNGNLSTSIEAYFALKLAGEDPQSAPLLKAKEYILRHGGIESSRVFTKIWLALFGQYDWDKIPSMPVELILLPTHFHFNIYEFSSWARATVVPLSIVLNIRPKFELPPAKRIPELYLHDHRVTSQKKFASYAHRLFFLFDRIAKCFERNPIDFLRNRAIRAAENWILEHQEESGDWGGIQPPMVYCILALRYLGYPVNHSTIVKGLKAIEDFCLEDEQGRRMQSCLSPIWDTALTVLALLEGGLSPDHPALKRATSWLVRQQIFTGGDWQVKNSSPPGGWAFEFVNTQYPDVDDSAVVLTTLHRLSFNQTSGLEFAIQKGMDWVLSMQSSCGGWAAFDRDNHMVMLNRIPFADQEAMVDYATADVTGRVLEAMGYFGIDKSHPQAVTGIQFLRDQQESDGCWWGRWGVNYIYGTWCVLRGLVTIGEDPKASWIQAALRWLKEHQNNDGGWGETCESYANPELRGQGRSTPSQTAWALMALMVGGEEDSPEVKRGIQYLLNTQKSDGTWDELHFTGTGFPKHFFIRYHNYRNCFPLMALGQYLRKLENKGRS